MTLAAIEDVRRALGLDRATEATVRDAGSRLEPEVEGWVDRFYARLVTDPAAMAVLTDEGRVVRLKRTLTAWCLELFSLPFDEAYARAREEIGRAHVRVGMPQHLMVTAMGGLRRDVVASVERLWASDPVASARVREAVEKALDLELALMLDAYRRRSLELSREAERALVAGQVADWVSDATHDVATAARCYAELLRRASSPEAREHWGARLRESLDAIARLSRPAPSVPEREEVALARTCEQAVAAVSLPPRTVVDRSVDPLDLRAVVHEEAVRAAVQEMVQSAANRDPGGTVRLTARRRGTWAVLEALDAGPGWPEGVRTVADAYGLPGGLGLALCQQIAALHGGDVELFEAPGGGAGVRLTLPALAREPSEEAARADPRPVRP